MVNRRYWLALCFLSLLPFALFAAKVKVTGEIDTARSGEHRRLEGRLSVFHVPGSFVDPKGFELDKRPLETEFVRDRPPSAEEIRLDSSIDPEMVVSVFRFQLPGKPKGLYILPSMIATVDGSKYRSVATTYEVTTAKASKALELEAHIEGEQPFYPGQHAFLYYRIYYDRNIELTEEHLPLLEADGFQKVGGKDIKDMQEGEYTVQEIRQEVRAVQPGTYTFGPSVIEGVTYEDDIRGQRKYDKQRVRASAPALSVEVVAFPSEGKPASFTGAVGQYVMKSKLLTSPKMDIGGRLEVGVDISGGTDIEDLVMSDVSCQPGYAGFFQIGDYPPFEQRDDLSKEFIIALRPLSAHITEVPPVEFSYFDPHTREYKTLRSDPIAIEVNPLISYKPDLRSGRPEEQLERHGPQEDQNPGLIQNRQNVTGVDWRISLGKPTEVKISPIYSLTANDLTSPRWKIEYVWMALATLTTLFLVQFVAAKVRRKVPVRPRILSSEDYLALAAHSKGDPANMARQIEEAFLLLMVERGWYDKKVSSPEQLSPDGLIGQVRSFLIDLQGRRYGGVENFTPREVLRSAKELYRTVRYGRGR